MRCLAFDTAKALDLKRAEMHSLVNKSMFQSKLLLTLGSILLFYVLHRDLVALRSQFYVLHRDLVALRSQFYVLHRDLVALRSQFYVLHRDLVALRSQFNVLHRDLVALRSQCQKVLPRD